MPGNGNERKLIFKIIICVQKENVDDDEQKRFDGKYSAKLKKKKHPRETSTENEKTRRKNIDQR